MKFVQKEFSCTTEEKKSKFLAFLLPYEDFVSTMKRLKEEHFKAVHYVYAYRYLNEFEQIVENSSDDGEPKGTSGKPCLNALKGAQIINSAVIVVRYFGGTKLGTGGLVRAYSSATNGIIAQADFETYEKKEIYSLSVSYANFSLVEYTLSKYDIKIIDKEFLNDAKLTLEASAEEFNKFKKEFPSNTIF